MCHCKMPKMPKFCLPKMPRFCAPRPRPYYPPAYGGSASINQSNVYGNNFASIGGGKSFASINQSNVFGNNTAIIG